jgi:hypothetical protein
MRWQEQHVTSAKCAHQIPHCMRGCCRRRRRRRRHCRMLARREDVSADRGPRRGGLCRRCSIQRRSCQALQPAKILQSVLTDVGGSEQASSDAGLCQQQACMRGDKQRATPAVQLHRRAAPRLQPAAGCCPALCFPSGAWPASHPSAGTPAHAAPPTPYKSSHHTA